MVITGWRTALALCAVLAVVACNDSSPQSPSTSAQTATISGTVVSGQSGDPVAGVTVDFQRHHGAMMMGGEWDGFEHMVTDAHGQFHFEYMHESMSHYRVMVHGTTDPQGMCYLDDDDDAPVVLRVP
ncbi:MAG TPA: hypothetical protein VFX92_11900 [Candidatus Krumholzibacteria bacterium]|nr:hypothetical protein [Candidatus Krumholzibacteria bacterium]